MSSRKNTQTESALSRSAGEKTKQHSRLLAALRVLGLARRAVPRVIVGKKAYVRWWQRVLAAVALAVLVMIIGVAITAAAGLLVLVAGLLFEGAII